MFSESLKSSILKEADLEISKSLEKSKSQLDKLLEDDTVKELANKLVKDLPKTKAWGTFNQILLKHKMLPKRKDGKKFIKVSYPKFKKLYDAPLKSLTVIAPIIS